MDNDEKTAAEYNLKEGDFIVAMVQKAKPVPKPKPEAAAEPKKDEEMKKEETTE